jgi:vancomycin resistance protein YoaR
LSKKRLLISIFIFVLLLAVGGCVALAFMLPTADRLAYGVTIAGVKVGGLTRQEAEGKIKPALEARLTKEITWRYEERSWRLTLKELGIVFDLNGALDTAAAIGREGQMFERVGSVLRSAGGYVKTEPQLTLPRQTVSLTLTRVSDAVKREPKDAFLSVEGEEVTLHPQKTGTELDMEAFLKQLEEIVRNGVEDDFTLPVKTKEPQVKTPDLQGFDCVLGGFSTSFAGSSQERGHNIAVAAEALNGTLIGAGETISFNAVVGPRSSETGYKTAPTYQGGKVVPGIGGGVCQVSSTTYNAFLLAGFDIVQRSNHAMPVHYLPAGRDATVVYGAIDLKARNPYHHSAYIMAGVNGKTLWLKILGNKMDKAEVTVTSQVTGEIPFSIIEKEDPSLPPGKKKVDQKGFNGKTSVTYRKIKRPGQPEKEEAVSRDSYHPMNKIILVGPKPQKQEPPAQTAEPVTPVTKPEAGGKALPPPPAKAATAKTKGHGI